jgi:hypothetical protein
MGNAISVARDALSVARSRHFLNWDLDSMLSSIVSSELSGRAVFNPVNTSTLEERATSRATIRIPLPSHARCVHARAGCPETRQHLGRFSVSSRIVRSASSHFSPYFTLESERWQVFQIVVCSWTATLIDGTWRTYECHVDLLGRVTRHLRLELPAQAVDATPCGALIRQCFRGRAICMPYSAKTYPGQRSGCFNPSERFWLLFSMQGGFKLSVASTH